MQTKLFQTLVTAGAIDHVTIWRGPKDGGQWSVFAYAEDNRDLGVVNAIEAARGGVRTWASLDSAYAWLQSAGWTGDVELSAASGGWQSAGQN